MFFIFVFHSTNQLFFTSIILEWKWKCRISRKNNIQIFVFPQKTTLSNIKKSRFGGKFCKNSCWWSDHWNSDDLVSKTIIWIIEMKKTVKLKRIQANQISLFNYFYIVNKMIEQGYLITLYYCHLCLMFNYFAQRYWTLNIVDPQLQLRTKKVMLESKFVGMMECIGQ